VTLRAIQATVERRNTHFATAATMTWASVLTAGAVSMSVVNPAAAQSRPGRNAVAGSASLRNLADLAPIVQRKERGPFWRPPSDTIRNSLLAKTDANWRKLT
jgi:hypothetical protein